MLRTTIPGALGIMLMLATTAMAADDNDALRKAPPPEPYAQVSKLVALPDFIPGLGTLYVDPDMLPAGPFLAYDRDGGLSATIFMTPIEDLKKGVNFDNLSPGQHNVASVDIYYNAGHPGVEMPHAHVVLFHDAKAKARLAK